MDAVHPVLLQIPDLAHRVVDTGLAHVLLVLTVGGDQVGQLLRDRGAGEGDCGAKLLCRGDRHDSGMDGNRDALGPHQLYKTVEAGVVKKHLCYQGGDAGIHFFL